jgi:NAD(P)-dependent dehydrogenase (short-subunit alcohol dehydrogenase family)
MINVVIGAGSGMGAEVARRLAPRGRLLVADRDLALVEQIAVEIGGDVEPVACDVTDQRQIDALFAQVGELGALVHTAGLSGSQAPGRTILTVNLMGTARVIRAAEAKAGPGTVVVCFASQSGYMVPELPALFEVLEDPLADGFLDELAEWYDVDDPSLSYQMSKRGVHRLIRKAAAPFGARGARILSLSPGINDTPMNRRDEERAPIMAQIIENSPLGRRGRTDEVAKVVAFLTSDDASYMTGSDVLVDGGMVAVIPEDTTGGKAS